MFYANKKPKYQGEMLNDSFNGYGIYHYPNGNYYMGFWKNGKRNGDGALYYKNGDLKYEGTFINDKSEQDFDEEGNDINFLKKTILNIKDFFN